MRLLSCLSFWLFATTLLACSSCKKNNSGQNDDPSKDSVRTLVNGLQFPWEILWGPDDHIWMTERGGRISRIDPANGAVQPLLTISEVESNGEGGMLGLALHPAFSEQPYLFVVYNYDKGGSYKEKVVRYTYRDNTLTEPKILLDNINASNIHNGSRLLIGPAPDYNLWITTGDASQQNDAQQTTLPNGKILRISTDGSIPADNPFPGNPVWSYGHRNPQGLVWANNVLYAAEHGPNIEDEVNIIEKQRNYGWPEVNGPCDSNNETAFCNDNNVKPPIWSSGDRTAAISGMDYYNNDRIPQWKNSLLVAALKDSRLYRLQLGDDGKSVKDVKTYFENSYGRLRDVCVSPAGHVYICTSNGDDDKVIEINNVEN